MVKQIRESLGLKISPTPDEVQCHFDNTQDPATEVKHNLYLNSASVPFTLAPGGTFTIDGTLGVSALRGIRVESDGTFGYSVSGGTAITCREILTPAATDPENPLKLARWHSQLDLDLSGADSVVISNPGGATQTIRGQIQIWGDPQT